MEIRAMAWRETCSVREKVRFCMAYEAGEVSMSELCREFDVSRRTGYAVLQRWRTEGPSGLAARSHAPHHCAHALSADVRSAILALRRRHPTWGPKKLKARLEREQPQTRWPATSTIGSLLDREGLVTRRKRRRHAAPRSEPLAACTAANDVWSVDPRFRGDKLQGLVSHRRRPALRSADA
jgi:transposase